jgi:hypothetical protein
VNFEVLHGSGRKGVKGCYPDPLLSMKPSSLELVASYQLMKI